MLSNKCTKGIHQARVEVILKLKKTGGHANESGLWMKVKSAMTTGVSQVVKWHRKTELQPQVAETK